MADLPLYSDLSEIHETGRKSAADAPEITGSEKQRADMAEQVRQHNKGVFSPPEVDDSAEQEPIDFDHINATIAENLEHRRRAANQEYVLDETREGLLDLAAYGGNAQSVQDFSQVGDALLAAGGGLRLEALVTDFAERYPAEADRWLESREAMLLQSHAAASAQTARSAQQQLEAEYVGQLEEFYLANPDYRPGGTKNNALAGLLAANPEIASSPAAWRKALEEAKRSTEDVARALSGTAEELAMRAAMRAEIQRRSPMRPATPEHRAAADAMHQRSVPTTLEELGADVLRRTRGYKQAASAAHKDEMRESFKRESRGSGFGEGAREQAARALKAREEERQGLRPPNRSI